MSLQSITNINIDFVEPKYIMINAKQYDDCSRLIYITCYNDGNLYNLSAKNHTAFIRFRKADGHYVYNFCDIDYKGRITVELTGQMLAASGICYAEIEVLNRGNVKVDADTGRITIIDQTARLATMTFEVNVYESTFDDSLVESSDDFLGLNDALNLLTADLSDAVQKAKSWAVGTGNVSRDGDEYDNSEYYSKVSKSYAIGSTGVRTNEDTDNAKYYSEQANASMISADESEANAAISEQNAKTSETNAATSESNSKLSESNAKTSEQNAKTSETNASVSEQNAKTSEANALVSEQNAKTSETNASTSESNAKVSEESAADSALMVQSYAVGGSGIRDGEDTDNAKWYYNEMKDMFVGLNIVYVPKGTISFSELATVKETAVAGYVYNISTDFVTDDSFREGSGHSYTAGVNVYYTVDGVWDCFGGTATPIATVDEVMAYLGI